MATGGSGGGHAHAVSGHGNGPGVGQFLMAKVGQFFVAIDTSGDLRDSFRSITHHSNAPKPTASRWAARVGAHASVRCAA